ncbi:HNH endonuclease [Natranaeroarchaeum sulfidigenes]|uniref:Restriction endonuclease, McrA/HNH family n=1 Tax=Natranaeroarchaeum sulfidigenes TaxID=2784880 RepID=A0A897MUW4_9EURY|nr:HNH endonuclease signature motif containing protein [Natranaeroarchaeum sulfidigenes]QSG04071.1 Restriction endonuclease, McrA/HNH family [Natranaeroarchaeum sulfidigenes]
MMKNTNESFPTNVRLEVFDGDGYRCRICGEEWVEKGGTARLEAHHIEDDPDGIEYHHPDNGTTLCEVCHHYITTRMPDDLPFQTDTVQEELKLFTYDFEIISTLSRRGPASVQEIMADIDDNKSNMATRERLWHLMGHHRRIDRLTHPLVDQSADTGEWGLPHQINRTARGEFPNDTGKLIKRFEDELVRRLLNYGIDRSKIAADMGVHERTTHYMQKRALAYRLPLGDDSSDQDLDKQSVGAKFQTLTSFLTDSETAQEGKSEQREDEVTTNAGEVTVGKSELSEMISQLETLITHLRVERSPDTSIPDQPAAAAEESD